LSPARRAPTALGLVAFTVAGCLSGFDTLGGREKCWPSGEHRAPSLWRGTLRIGASGGQLDTREGDVIPLLPGALTTRVANDGTGQLLRGSEVVARAGDDVTLFGGAGADGYLVVCAVEEVHSRS
jgi:hypothetical protein